MKLLILLSFSHIFFTASLHADAPSGKPQQLTSPEQVPEGLGKSDWASIRAAYEAGLHAFQPIEGGWQARNPGQQWITKFDGRGFLVEPRAGGWTWGLELESYGRGESRTTIEAKAPAMTAEGMRLVYRWDETLREWWVNDARGLEHGFAVSARPTKDAPDDSPLSLTLAVRGTLQPRITADAQAIEFRDAARETVLTYGELKVWDADGKMLAYRFVADAASDTSLRLVVKERGARFPLTIGVQETTNLGLPFADFPMNAAGFSTLINGAGKLEFEFTAPDNAAFFRLESQ